MTQESNLLVECERLRRELQLVTAERDALAQECDWMRRQAAVSPVVMGRYCMYTPAPDGTPEGNSIHADQRARCDAAHAEIERLRAGGCRP